MYCNNCGNQLKVDAKFCSVCGMKSSKPNKFLSWLRRNVVKNKILWLATMVATAVVIAIIIVILSISGDTSAVYGYDTPEEAAAAYVEAVLEGDAEVIVRSASMAELRGYVNQLGLPEVATREEYLETLQEYIAEYYNNSIDYRITKAELQEANRKLEKSVAVSRYGLTEEEYNKCGRLALVYVVHEPSYYSSTSDCTVLCIEFDGRWYVLAM